MSAWDSYHKRIDNVGGDMRTVMLHREGEMIARKLFNSLSYFNVGIEYEGVPRESIPMIDVAIINSDNYNEKYIYSYPGENLDPGDLITWMDNKWLITEKDFNNELYTRCKMMQCNYLLKWIQEDEDGTPIVREQWCVVDDGTKLKCA